MKSFIAAASVCFATGGAVGFGTASFGLAPGDHSSHITVSIPDSWSDAQVAAFIAESDRKIDAWAGRELAPGEVITHDGLEFKKSTPEMVVQRNCAYCPKINACHNAGAAPSAERAKPIPRPQASPAPKPHPRPVAEREQATLKPAAALKPRTCNKLRPGEWGEAALEDLVRDLKHEIRFTNRDVNASGVPDLLSKDGDLFFIWDAKEGTLAKASEQSLFNDDKALGWISGLSDHALRDDLLAARKDGLLWRMKYEFPSGKIMGRIAGSESSTWGLWKLVPPCASQ